MNNITIPALGTVSVLLGVEWPRDQQTHMQTACLHQLLIKPARPAASHDRCSCSQTQRESQSEVRKQIA